MPEKPIDSPAPEAPQLNGWILQVDPDCPADLFSVNLELEPSLVRGLANRDGVALCREVDGDAKIVGIARIFRLRARTGSTTIYFDTLAALDPVADLPSLGLTAPTGTLERVEWPKFSSAVKSAMGQDFADLPPIAGKTAAEQAYIRWMMDLAVRDDLLGPANGPREEVVGMSVRDRYLVGKLAPKDTPLGEENDEDLGGEGGKGAEGDDGNEVEASKSQTLVPSSLGMTFCIDAAATTIELEATWGRYERGESETEVNEKTGKPERAWKRTPSGGKNSIPMTEGPIPPFAPDPNCPEVLVQGTVRAALQSGDRLVTLFLVNDQPKPTENQDAAWVFQPELIVRGLEGAPIFRRRPVLDSDGEDPERSALEMIYRRQVEFAVGHGVAVHAETQAEHPEQGLEVRTIVMPEYQVPVTETPGLEPEDRPAMQQLIADGLLDMEKLAELERPELAAALRRLTGDYKEWIKEQRDRVSTELTGYETPAEEAMARCDAILARLDEGVVSLETSDDALEAFRFANRAMARQRVRSIYSLLRRRGDKVEPFQLNIPRNRSWRPFQLAFVLLSIPGLADPNHKDRTKPLEAHADLLWFPTGGGKTEAYLGVAAFTMGIRRLQGVVGGFNAARGLAVIMRYTLRLLTIQQFQRATALLCAMETIRNEDEAKWGAERFTLGLWVGNKVTPGTTKQSHAAIEAERDGKRGTGSTPAQLTFCPWCGTEILPGRDIHVDQEAGRSAICCGDKLSKCEFSKAKSGGLGLPVVVVDDEIYRRPPTMLIGTVDKFAMMAWRGQVRTLFGRADQECDRHGLLWPDAECTGNHTAKGKLPKTKMKVVDPIRPPDLIIQDEFHLISGPLGTMVGLYETAVDELCAWKLGDTTVHPKVIASTATVRKASEQVHNVFMRKVAVFPPHGLDIGDNFFSVQRPVESKPGRLYVGICSPGSSRPAVLIRLYVALLTAGQSLYESFGAAADPYMTVVGYFNSLRELGGMKRLAEDDVQTRSYRVQMSKVHRPGLAQRSVNVVDELTSRVSSKEIPKKLDQLEVKFKKQWAKGETRAIDVVLATNMLSVGVDVNRIGLMAVNGQPKNTAEYIQATSRVGRAFPGIVFTVLTWSRPRDLSHYETFEHYHATFYKHVEAQSVTPFAPRAMDRGLTGTMVGLLRHQFEELNPNLGAEKLDSTSRSEVATVKAQLSDRAWKVTNKNKRKQTAEGMVADRIDRWVKEATRGGRRVGYEPVFNAGDIVPLLKKPGVQRWDELTVPMSLREVEPGVNLVMDSRVLEDGPAWKSAPQPSNDQAQ